MRGTGYQAVTLSTHCTLYRQQICAILILFEFSALEAEIILSFGHSWPFFFLLMRLQISLLSLSVTQCSPNHFSYCWAGIGILMWVVLRSYWISYGLSHKLKQKYSIVCIKIKCIYNIVCV